MAVEGSMNIPDHYFLAKPATGRFQLTCDICKEYKAVHNINYIKSNYECGPAGFVCSEECFNLWLMQVME